MLEAIRNQMQQHNLAAYIIMNKDPHLSEYLPAHFSVMPTLTGFTGSTGTMLVTETEAHVWTDSRYFIQAESELADSPFELKKLQIPHTPEHIDWLKETYQSGDRVGVDSKLVSIALYQFIEKQLSTKGIELVDVDILSMVWEDRPALPLGEVFEHEIAYAGKSVLDKLNQIRSKYQPLGCTHTIQTALDDVAWTFNIRCKDDIPYNPVPVGYALIGDEEATLFMNPVKLPQTLKDKLAEANVSIQPYEALHEHLEQLPTTAKVFIDPTQLNYQLYSKITARMSVHKGMSIAYLAKAIKNEVEINHMKSVMVKDGVAMVKLLRWLEKEIPNGTVTEVNLAEQLYGFRQAQGAVGESFSTIAGYKGHGAIVHYRATEKTDVTLQNEGILLLDSGGQYINGTTDITRTIALGEPTAEQVRNNTLVLKGHIQLDMAKFVKGTYGNQLDSLARGPLWKYGLNYGHGTGHGIGFYLNVHEGPHSISPRLSARKEAYLQPGMMVTNEPGFYKENEYGIRIENIVLVKESTTTEFGDFYEFETLTLCPLDTRLIDKSLLTKEEIDWVNDYHAKVKALLSPQLEEAEVEWLNNQTKAL